MKRQTKRHRLGPLRTESNKLSRRQFMAQDGRVVAGSVLAGVALSRVQADAEGCYPVPVPGKWKEI